MYRSIGWERLLLKPGFLLYTCTAFPALCLPVHPSKLVLPASPAQRPFCWFSLSALGVQPLSVSGTRSWLIHLKGARAASLSLMPALKPRVPSTGIFMTEETHSKTSLGPEPNRGCELWAVSHMKGLCGRHQNPFMYIKSAQRWYDHGDHRRRNHIKGPFRQRVWQIGT